MAAQLSGPSGGSRFDLRQNSDINVTPFVDVMLVLLIIFMVSAPLATVSIKVDLPPAVPSPNKPLKKPTFISIQKSGEIYLSGETQRKTSLASLAADLQGALGVANPQNEVILIRSDREVHYKDFMAVVNQLQTEGFYKVGLIIEDTTDA